MTLKFSYPPPPPPLPARTRRAGRASRAPLDNASRRQGVRLLKVTRVQCSRVSITAIAALALLGVACGIAWAAENGDLGSEVDTSPNSEHFGRHFLGGMDQTCKFCGASHWQQERLTGSSNSNPCFGGCCRNGKVQLPPYEPPPEPLLGFLEGQDAASKKFRKSLRAYNCSLQLASSGVKTDERVTGPRGPGSFSIHGASYHQIGPLQPPAAVDGSHPGENDPPPQFAQLYIHDGQNELDNRMAAIGTAANLDRDVVDQLQKMLHEKNHWVRVFKAAADGASDDLTIVIKGDAGKDCHMPNGVLLNLTLKCSYLLENVS